MNPKDNVRQLVTQGKLSKALDLSLCYLHSSDPNYNNATLLSSTFNTLQQEKSLGLLATDESKAKLAQLTNNILNLIERWNPGGDLSVLQREVQGLEFDSEALDGIIHTINCNRELAVKKFRKFFNRKKKESRKFQFHFVAACRREMPNSFSKRLIFQIIDEELSGEHDSINYPFREDHSHIKIEKLPLGSDLASSQKKLKSYFDKRFHFNGAHSIGNFLESGSTRLPYKYVVSVFDLSEKEWEGDEGEISDYFQWIIDKFNFEDNDSPVFIFFIVIYIQSLYDPSKVTPRQKEILQEIESLCTVNDLSLLTELAPVEATDFEDWLSELDIRDPNQTRGIVQALVQTLQPEERKMFEEVNCLHMKDIEPVQRMIYDLANH